MKTVDDVDGCWRLVRWSYLFCLGEFCLFENILRLFLQKSWSSPFQCGHQALPMRRRYSSQGTTPSAPNLRNHDNAEKKCLRNNQQNHETKMCKVSGFQILNSDITVVGERDGSAKMCSCQMRIVTKK